MIFNSIINNQKVDTKQFHEIRSVSNGELLGKVSTAGEKELDAAVNAARTALESGPWSNTTPHDRSVILGKVAATIAHNAPELARYEALTTGGTFARITSVDFPILIDIFTKMADAVMRYPFVNHLSHNPLLGITHATVVKEPVGVCGFITAWNFPILLFGWKLVSAIAAGCTMVVKPAPTTPLSTVRLAELLMDVLPAGVLNVICSDDNSLGQKMAEHPGIDKIAFTGSVATGKKVQKTAAETLKRTTLELGGKGAGIVCKNANLDIAIPGALFGVYFNSGQACESGTRLLVHESLYDDVVTRLVNLSKKVKVGDPMEPGVNMGPIGNKMQFDKIMNYIDIAKKEGATIACGGESLSIAGSEAGHFVGPTIITNVTNKMTVAREEIFGPVLCVIPFKDDAEAIAMANDSDFGLSAGVWNSDLLEAQNIALKLKAGTVFVNDWHMLRTDAPFGGFKQSGLGREIGEDSIAAYTESKTIHTLFENDPDKKLFWKSVIPSETL